MFSFTKQQSEKASSPSAPCNDYTLEMLSEMVARPAKGPKNGRGFLRGILNGERRCDEDLEYSKLLIIDGDGGLDGAPTPSAECCHDALCTLGYNHVLYTTHSHTNDYHKYRVVVELTEQIEAHELVANMNQLMKELRAQGCALKYVHEMKTWSQIWFFPRRLDPDDGQFIHLTYFSGKMFDTIHVEKSAEPEPVEEKLEEGVETLDQMYSNILSGAEFHQSLNNLIIQYIRDGLSKAMVLAQMKALMNSSKLVGTERWLERFNDLERSIDGAIKLVQEEATARADFEINLSDDSKPQYRKPPMPPGKIGRFIAETMKNMQDPEIEFAFPMVFGLVAGICGAHFNIKSKTWSGLNIQMAIVANTGHGKGQIGKFYNMFLAQGLNGRIVNLSNTEGAISFLGSSSYTNQKGLHDDLEKGRSRVVCISEAGFMLGAKTGSVDEFIAYTMDNYVNSAHDCSATTRKYSHHEDSLKHLNSPALTMIMESTEEVLKKSLTNLNAIDSGLIPRTTMFKLGNPTPTDTTVDDRNEEDVWVYSDDIIEQLDKLIKTASVSQVCKTVNPVKINMTKEQYLSYKKHKGEYKSTEGKASAEIAVQSRMAHKMLKFAALCYCFNHWDRELEATLDDESWAWAEEMCQWECDQMWYNLSYLTQDNDYELPMKFVAERIFKSLMHANTNDKQRDAKFISYKTLCDRLYIDKDGNSRGAISRFAAERKMAPSTYIDMILKNMERQNMIKIYEQHPLFRKGVRCIQILEGINYVI